MNGCGTCGRALTIDSKEVPGCTHGLRAWRPCWPASPPAGLPFAQDSRSAQPVADAEAHVPLFKPASTLNTGNVQNERAAAQPDRIGTREPMAKYNEGTEVGRCPWAK